jgi:hypothetical protein
LGSPDRARKIRRVGSLRELAWEVRIEPGRSGEQDLFENFADILDELVSETTQH